MKKTKRGMKGKGRRVTTATNLETSDYEGSNNSNRPQHRRSRTLSAREAAKLKKEHEHTDNSGDERVEVEEESRQRRLSAFMRGGGGGGDAKLFPR